ncbi:MAG: hypothetical protein KBT13_04415, partial [Bacteroidales bacterium]|nr:hypothetical protein [Candidatus Sodaliphilus limicaballi]
AQLTHKDTAFLPILQLYHLSKKRVLHQKHIKNTAQEPFHTIFPSALTWDFKGKSQVEIVLIPK